MPLVQAGVGLIEQQQRRLLDQRPGHQHQPLLPAAQLSEAGRREVARAHLDQRGARQLAVCDARPAAQANAPGAAQQHHVVSAQRCARGARVALRHVAHEPTAHRRQRRLPQHLDPPRSGRQHAQQQPQQCRLTASVGTDQPDELARRHPEGDVLQHARAVVGEVDPVAADRLTHPDHLARARTARCRTASTRHSCRDRSFQSRPSGPGGGPAGRSRGKWCGPAGPGPGPR